MKASVKKEMEQTLSSVVPVRAGAFNQAIMDLGALVCIPNGMPLCEQCPLAAHCIAREKGIQLELPVKTKKKSRRIEEKTILLLEYQGKYAIQKRANKGLLAGLWELPSVEGKYSEQEIRTILKEENQQADIYQILRAVQNLRAGLQNYGTPQFARQARMAFMARAFLRSLTENGPADDEGKTWF